MIHRYSTRVGADLAGFRERPPERPIVPDETSRALGREIDALCLLECDRCGARLLGEQTQRTGLCSSCGPRVRRPRCRTCGALLRGGAGRFDECERCRPMCSRCGKVAAVGGKRLCNGCSRLASARTGVAA